MSKIQCGNIFSSMVHVAGAAVCTDVLVTKVRNVRVSATWGNKLSDALFLVLNTDSFANIIKLIEILNFTSRLLS